MEVVRKKKQIMLSYENEIRDFITKFEEKHNRKPLENEIIDNCQDKMNMDVLKN